MTLFLENPFFVLGVTPESSRSEILAKAEEAALLDDPDRVSQCRATLTNPAKRLDAELRFLPGVRTDEIEAICSALKKDPASVVNWPAEKLSGIARSNVMIAAVSSIDLSTSAKAPSLIPLIWDAAKSFDQQTIEQIEAQINQSRTAARFPSVKDTARMSDILQDIRREYLKNITTAFDSLRTAEVIDVLSKELSLAESERAKSSGSVIPALLEDLMNSYEIAAQVFINKEKETADRLISEIPQGCKEMEMTSGSVMLLQQLQELVQKWVTVIGILDRFHLLKGESYEPTRSLFVHIRQLAVKLSNEYQCFQASKGITEKILRPLAFDSERTKAAEEDLRKLCEILDNSNADNFIPVTGEVCLNPQARGLKGLGDLTSDFSSPDSLSALSGQMIFAGKGEKTAAPTLASRVTAASARQTGSSKSVSTQKEKAESSSSGGIGTQLLNGFYSILFLILILIIGVIALGVSKSYTTNNLEQTPSERVDTPDFSGISDSDRTGIIEACKDQGSPANVYSCQSEEVSKLKQIGSAPDMSDIFAWDQAYIIDACKDRGSPANVYSCQRERLSNLKSLGFGYYADTSAVDRAGIIDACKNQGSPANVESCQSEEVSKLKQIGSAPDMSDLFAWDRAGIIDACKDQGSPANVYRCQKEELSKLKRIGAAPPDMSDISAVDRAGIIDACKGWGSPADVYFCQREKLSMLRGTDSASYMDDISDADRAGIIDICRYRGSLADDYSSCQRKELNKLRRTGPAPDMSDISDADRARIIDACRNEGSPADVYSCQGEELSKLRRF